jgi:hypothetical protein
MSQGRGLHIKTQDWVLLMTKLFLFDGKEKNLEKIQKHTHKHAHKETEMKT